MSDEPGRQDQAIARRVLRHRLDSLRRLVQRTRGRGKWMLGKVFPPDASLIRRLAPLAVFVAALVAIGIYWGMPGEKDDSVVEISPVPTTEPPQLSPPTPSWERLPDEEDEGGNDHENKSQSDDEASNQQSVPDDDNPVRPDTGPTSSNDTDPDSPETGPTGGNGTGPSRPEVESAGGTNDDVGESDPPVVVMPGPNTTTSTFPTSTSSSTTSTSTTTTVPRPPGALDECPGLSSDDITQAIGGNWTLDWASASMGPGVVADPTWTVLCLFQSTDPPPSGSTIPDYVQVTLDATETAVAAKSEYDARLDLYAGGTTPEPIASLGDEAHRIYDDFGGLVTVLNGSEMAAVFYNSEDPNRFPLVEPLAFYIEARYWP